MMSKIKKINPQGAGIDIGAERIFVCAEDDGYKTFGCFTHDFRQAAAYLKSCGIKSVVMEATGVYWIALKDIIESEGIEAILVRAGDAKQLPGRDKTDGTDCQWLRTLHQHGLLRACFIPDENIRELRPYIRTRQDHIEMAAAHIQHMQDAFTLMNIRLHQVISQIQGASGLRIIQAILQGERDAEKLALLCDKQILKLKHQNVILSLQGNYKKEYLFKLRQAYQAWQFYNTLISECDHEIDAWLQQNTNNKNPLSTKTKGKEIRHHKPEIKNFHNKLLLLTDEKDIGKLPGLTDYSAIQIIAEVGLDMTKWPSDKHFVSWLGLAPKKHYSGKMKRHKKGQVNTKAGQLFKESAYVLLRSTKIALGNFGRRIKAKKGPVIAIKAMARKLALMFYNVLTKGMQYVETGIENYEKLVRKTELERITKWAHKLGLSVSANQ